MGTIAARKASQIVGNAYKVLAVELVCAAQAADFRHPQRLGKGTRWVYEHCRARVDFLERDRVLAGDFDKIALWMKSYGALAGLEKEVPIE